MRYGGTRLACLTLALLLTCMLVYVLSPAAIDRRVESFSGGEVTTSYTHGPKPLTDNLPVIQVTDASGNSIDSLTINVFAVMPHANVKYLGAVGSDSNTVILPYNITSKISSEIIPTWRNELKHLGGFEPSLLLFIDALRKLSNGAYAVYPQVKAVLLNLQLLSKGYKLNSITIKINTSTVKPSIITLNTTTPQIKSAPPNTTNQGCVVLHNGPRNLVYCTKWKLQKECAHLENTLIPVMALRIPYGYYTDPQAVYEADLLFSFQESTTSYFKIYAGIKLSNALQVSYESVETLEDFSFRYYMHFYNNRWTSESPSFKDDAIIVIGFKGSATLGLFREYDAFCENNEPWCPEEDFTPTSTTANITLMDINTVYDGQHWTATAYGYDIDDNVGDGLGWDQYWNLVKEHAQPGEASSGEGSATYLYQGNRNNENYIGIDIADLIAVFVKNPELSSHFPVDAGIGFSIKEASPQVLLASVWNANQYSDYYVYITPYMSKDEVYIDGTYMHLKLMIFNVDDYSPW